MIEFGDMKLDFGDPFTIVVAALAGILFFVTLFIVTANKRSNQSIKLVQQMANQMNGLGQRVQSLSDGQQQLFGGLNAVTEAQAQQQSKTLQVMEKRLSAVTETMTQNLSSSARNTAQSLGELQQRLRTIDKAQENITKLSGDVLSLQDILSNKQTRGAFGEIQLHDIVSKALPSDSYRLQFTLSNGKRADCIISLPNPPGPIVIDSKFPLEPYERLRKATTEQDLTLASREFRAALRSHMRAISEKYIIEGETADGALMFLPSEAVYAELHANFPEIVREGFAARVWIVSPTTCMATLNTMRAILKDARMREQAGAIRKELGLLYQDVDRLGQRVDNLDRHFGQAAKDISEIKISAEKAGKRARRLDNFDFEELAPETDEGIVPLPSSSKN
jgi:DNA recombination protein RmuC